MKNFLSSIEWHTNFCEEENIIGRRKESKKALICNKTDLLFSTQILVYWIFSISHIAENFLSTLDGHNTFWQKKKISGFDNKNSGLHKMTERILRRRNDQRNLLSISQNIFCQPYNDDINSMKNEISVDFTENILYSIQQH
jgi:hypothetical protein